jgi:hypothetical protein
MLDQSFSIENFETIFLRENRKGNIKKKYLSNEYFDKHLEFNVVLNKKNNLIDEKKIIFEKLSDEELDNFAQRLEQINKEKEEIRNNLFTEYSKIINSEEVNQKFKFHMQYDKEHKIYITKKDGVNFFGMKQLQYNIRKTFKVVQADRNKIIKQVYNFASDGFPKVIVKTDISKFYESINQEILIEKIKNNTLLSPLSRKLIKRLLFDFENIKDKSEMKEKKGIPRGFGISAYLSELYMRDFDNEIKALPDLIYYARYVDDIIAIFAPKSKSQTRDYIREIKEKVKSIDLQLNDNEEARKDKTKKIELFYHRDKKKTDEQVEILTFLGYDFEITHYPKFKSNSPKTDVFIEISKDKIENKFKPRIQRTIDVYNQESKVNEKRARKMLFDRLKFLTSNYNLNKSKKSIKAGIFYSNQMMQINSSFKSLDNLNEILKNGVQSLKTPEKIEGLKKENVIEYIINNKSFSFVNGYFEKKFCVFKFNEKEQKYYNKKFKKRNSNLERTVSKFEVIKSIWKDI